jgi:hypothetical protein
MTEQRPVFAENLDPYDDEQSLRVHPLIAPDDLVFPVGHPVTGFYMLNV